jgi:predicted nucleic acid-binding protein
MSGRVFIDTNILVYADDADSGIKQDQAQLIITNALESGLGATSTQVLQEYFVVATRKLHMPADVAQRKVELLTSLAVIAIDVAHIVEAIKLHRLYALSFWDALVVQGARLAGCSRLLSEDMRSGQMIEGVTIENPFV